MTRSRPTTVLFDFDQTLVDSADGFRCAEREIQGRILADLGMDDEGFRACLQRLGVDAASATCSAVSASSAALR